MSTTYAVRVDFAGKAVSIQRDRRAVFEKDKAVEMARLWAAHHGFELQEEPEVD